MAWRGFEPAAYSPSYPPPRIRPVCRSLQPPSLLIIMPPSASAAHQPHNVRRSSLAQKLLKTLAQCEGCE
eukprot:1723905-Rhodomonas_salina.1